MKKGLLFSLLILFLLSSCVHHSPFVDEYFYQALGNDGEVVITADVGRMREDESGVLSEEEKENRIIKKAERISLSLLDGTLSGAVEGDISKFTTNTALAFSSSYEKEEDKENSLRWYNGGGMNIYSPQNGILLFTDGSYSDYYERTIENRVKKIDDETAGRMGDSLFSFYAFRPESLEYIGFDLPETVRKEITYTCLLFDSAGGSLLLSGFIKTTSSSAARALSTLMRNQIIQEKRRSGESVDYKALSKCFTLNDCSLDIEGYTLSGKFEENAVNMIRDKFGGIIQ